MRRQYKEPEIEILEYSLNNLVATDLLSDNNYGELGGGTNGISNYVEF